MAVVPSRTFVLSTTPTAIPQMSMCVGDTDHIGFDVTAIEALGNLSGTPAWASSNTSAVTTSGEAYATPIVKAIVTGVAEGDALLTCTIVTGNGHTLKRSICIHVRSPL